MSNNMSIIPVGTSAVITEDEHRHGHGDQFDRLILAEQAAFARVAASSHTDTVGTIKDTRYDLAALASRDAAAAALAACKISDEVAASSNAVQRQVCDLSAAQISGFKDAQATAYQVEGRALIEATKNAAASQLQAQVNASAVALQAQVNASAAAAQLAACCCELKERIATDGGLTRSLIDANEKDRLREKAEDCERKLAAYYSRNTVPVIPG